MSMPSRPKWCGRCKIGVAVVQCTCDANHIEGDKDGYAHPPPKEDHYRYLCDTCANELGVDY